MAAVDGVAAVDVGGDEVAVALVGAEGVCLVRAGVCAQQLRVAEVVCVGEGAAGVVGREAEGVEVLRGRDDGVEVVVVFEGGRGEVRLDDLAGDVDRVVFLEV